MTPQNVKRLTKRGNLTKYDSKLKRPFTLETADVDDGTGTAADLLDSAILILTCYTGNRGTLGNRWRR